MNGCATTKIARRTDDRPRPTPLPFPGRRPFRVRLGRGAPRLRPDRQGRADHDGDQPVALVRRLSPARRAVPEGNRQRHPARREPVRRRAGEDPQLAARERGKLRPARDRQQLDGRDVRRRFPRVAHRSRSLVQARSGRQHVRRNDLLERQAEDVRPEGRQADGRSGQRQRRGALLPQGPLRPAWPQAAADLGRAPCERNEAERAAERLRLRASRRPRLGARRLRELHVQLRRRHLREREPPATSPSCSTAPRTGVRSSTTCVSARRAGIRRRDRSARER